MAVVSNACCPPTGFQKLRGHSACCRVCIVSSHLFLTSAFHLLDTDSCDDAEKSVELRSHKDFLNKLAGMMPASTLLTKIESAAALFSKHDCSPQDWHQDNRAAPQWTLKANANTKVTRHWSNGRHIPGIFPLGTASQKLRIIMGSHELTQVCRPGHQTCD
jgi:hypothetical protein